MFKHDSQENFKELTIGFFEGKISRRHFVRQAMRLGVSIAVLNRIAPYAFAAGENLVDSDPSVPHEAPVTKERIEFLEIQAVQGHNDRRPGVEGDSWGRAEVLYQALAGRDRWPG